MSEGLKLIELSRGRPDIKRFWKVAHTVYADDPHWVAPMLMDLQSVLSFRSPLFQHAQLKLWIVTRNGRDVGRIAGLIDSVHQQMHNDAEVFFGFFEVLEDPEASHLLFDALFTWARRQKMTRTLGPMNPSTNGECGLLVDGFDQPPVFMMPYNPRYYPALVEAEGFKTEMNLLSYSVDLSVNPGRRLNRIFARFRRANPSFVLRRVTRKTLESDAYKMREVYNDAWEKNWGFIPMNDAEIAFMAQRLRPLLTEGLVLIAEARGEPAAFLLTVLDYNEALKPLKGRFVSWKLPRFLLYLFGVKKPQLARIMALGVKKQFRGHGFEAAMLTEAFTFCLQGGYRAIDVSWILENNLAIQKLIKVFGGQINKTYRIYARGNQ